MKKVTIILTVLFGVTLFSCGGSSMISITPASGDYTYAEATTMNIEIKWDNPALVARYTMTEDNSVPAEPKCTNGTLYTNKIPLINYVGRTVSLLAVLCDSENKEVAVTSLPATSITVKEPF